MKIVLVKLFFCKQKSKYLFESLRYGFTSRVGCPGYALDGVIVFSEHDLDITITIIRMLVCIEQIPNDDSLFD